MQTVYIVAILLLVACFLSALGYKRTQPKEEQSPDPWENNDTF